LQHYHNLTRCQQYSYSVYVTRAKGGRFELTLVSALTAALFLCSGLLLPYVPTILASALVLFFGIELFLEAIWEASKTLAWMEYAVVLATLAACTFLGFAEGFGVGIGAAAAAYLMYGVIDSVRTLPLILNMTENAGRTNDWIVFVSRHESRGGTSGTSCSSQEPKMTTMSRCPSREGCPRATTRSPHSRSTRRGATCRLVLM
jgi:hypothetical protein